MSAAPAAAATAAPGDALSRGRFACLLDPAPARQRLAALNDLARAVARGAEQPSLVAWRSEPALMVTRAETRLPGFAQAAAALAEEGWPVLARESGGAAFALAPRTLQVSWITSKIELAADFGRQPEFDTLYRLLATRIIAALARLGLEATIGEVRGAPCAGRHDIAVGGRKVAGLAQRWSGEGAVTVEASLVVDGDPQALADRVNRLYELAGSDWRCDRSCLTSLEAELGRIDVPGQTAARFIDALVPEGLRGRSGFSLR